MILEQALQLKPGREVWYPADRGDLSGYGKVKSVGTTVQKNHLGREFVWVTVYQHILGHTSVWPSNRLC